MPHLGYETRLSIEVTTKDVKNLKVGDDFEGTIKGRIIALEGEREREAYEDEMDKAKDGKIVYPPRVDIELSEVKVKQPNEFSALLDEEDY